MTQSGMHAMHASNFMKLVTPRRKIICI